VYSVEYIVITDHDSKNQALCNAVAVDIGGELTKCEKFDVKEKGDSTQVNVDKSYVKIVVKVAGPKRASSYRKNAAQIMSRAIAASSATNTQFVSAEAYEDVEIITTTTTLQPTVENILRSNYGDEGAVLALEKEKANLDAICTTGAFVAISDGYPVLEKYELRQDQYIQWYKDNFGNTPTLSTINDGAALAFKEIYKAGSSVLDQVCTQIRQLYTITQDANLVATVTEVYNQGTSDRPAVTVWSTLYTKEQGDENDGIQKVIHNSLVETGKANDRFIHYCKTDGVADYVKKCQHIDVSSNWYNAFWESDDAKDHLIASSKHCDDVFVSLAKLSDKEREDLCKLGRDRYEVDSAAVTADYWNGLLSNYNSLKYVVADIGYNAKMTIEQVEFLLSADGALWGAFAGDEFDKNSKACVDAMKDFPIDIWDDKKAEDWKNHEQHLKNSRNKCLRVEYGKNRRYLSHVEQHIDHAAFSKPNTLCQKLSGHALSAETLVTEEDVMIAILKCKSDLVATVELFPNHYDEKTPEEEKTYFEDHILKKEKFPIGDLAFWDDAQKRLENKWHSIIEKIEVRAWTHYIDHHAKFCAAMSGVTQDRVSKLSGTFKDHGLDMTESAVRIKQRYTSVAPTSKSGFVMVTVDDKGTHMTPILTLKIHVAVKVTKDNKEALRLKVQQYVDMGTADDVVANGDSAGIVYDTDENSIVLHAKGISDLQKNGVVVGDATYDVTSIQIPRHFTVAQKALEDAGATVSHAEVKCLIDLKTAKLQLSHDLAGYGAKKEHEPAESQDTEPADANGGTGLIVTDNAAVSSDNEDTGNSGLTVTDGGAVLSGEEGTDDSGLNIGGGASFMSDTAASSSTAEYAPYGFAILLGLLL